MNSYLHYLTMLQPGVLSAEPSIPATKPGVFDWCDVAGALAHLTRRQQLLLLLKGASDHGVWQELSYLITLDVCASMLPGWLPKNSKVINPERLQRLITTALFEWVSPPICPTCGGHAERYAEIQREVCPRCFGSSTVKLKSSARAAGLGVTRSAYNRRWRKRYEDVLTYLYAIEDAAGSKLVEQLRRS